jgi:hypothetical protein
MTNKTPETHPKYIIITDESMHIPEQGHGYPASEYKYEKIERFHDEESLKQYIKKYDQSSRPSWQAPKKLKIYAVTPVDYNTEVKISLT